METLGSRIKKLRLDKKISQQKLADIVGVSKTSIIYWEKDDNLPKHESLKTLAKAFGVSTDYLTNGFDQSQNQSLGDMSQSQYKGLQWPALADLPARHDGIPPSRETPVISWVQAGDYTEVLSGDLSQVIEWIPYNPKAGKHGFALIVKGRSMEPMFNPDDRIYINPTFQLDELHTGSLVVMSCNGDEEATFKELVVEDGEYYLRPLNPNWHKQIMPIDGNCRLVGKVVGKFVIYD